MFTDKLSAIKEVQKFPNFLRKMVAGTLQKFVDMISDMIFEIEHLFEAL